MRVWGVRVSIPYLAAKVRILKIIYLRDTRWHLTVTNKWLCSLNSLEIISKHIPQCWVLSSIHSSIRHNNRHQLTNKLTHLQSKSHKQICHRQACTGSKNSLNTKGYKRAKSQFTWFQKRPRELYFPHLRRSQYFYWLHKGSSLKTPRRLSAWREALYLRSWRGTSLSKNLSH